MRGWRRIGLADAAPKRRLRDEQDEGERQRHQGNAEHEDGMDRVGELVRGG
jgi:hypothetical protein